MTNSNYFACGFCGSEYSNIKDRMECEHKCLENETRQQKQRERDELSKNQKVRQDELTDLKNQIDALCVTYGDKLTSYCKDYKEHNDCRVTLNKLSDREIVRNIFDTLRF